MLGIRKKATHDTARDIFRPISDLIEAVGNLAWNLLEAIDDLVCSQLEAFGNTAWDIFKAISDPALG